MVKPEHTGSDDDKATSMGGAATAGVRATQPRDVAKTKITAKPKSRTSRTGPLEVEIPTSAEELPETLKQFVKNLRQVARRLKNKKDGDTIEVPIVMRQHDLTTVNSLESSEKQAVGVETIELRVPTSAGKMGDILSKLANEMQSVAKKPKGTKPVIVVIASCNGADGGDGGGGGDSG